MSLIRKIAVNSGYFFTGYVLSGILSLVIAAYIARYLGPTVFGKFSLVIAFISFFTVLSNLNIDTILTRELSRNFERRNVLIGNAFTIKGILSVFAVALSVIVVYFTPYDTNTKLAIVFRSSVLIFLSYSLTLTSIFQSRFDMKWAAGANLASKVLFGLLAFAVINLKLSFVLLIIASSVGFVLETLILFFASRKYARPGFFFDRKVIKWLIMESLPIAISGMFYIIYARIDVLMLSFMKGAESIGFYSAAYSLIESTYIIPSTLMISMFPLFSLYYKSSIESFQHSIRITLKLITMIAFPMAVGTMFLSSQIISLVYGSEFGPSASALSILVWATAFVFINIVLSSILVASNRQNKIVYIALFGALFSPLGS